MNMPHKAGDRGWHKATGEPFKCVGSYHLDGVLHYACMISNKGTDETIRWPADDLLWRPAEARATMKVTGVPYAQPYSLSALDKPSRLVTGPGKKPIKGIMIDGNRLVICWREDGPRRVEASILFDDGSIRSF